MSKPENYPDGDYDYEDVCQWQEQAIAEKDKQIAELVAALQQSAIRDRALGDSHHAFNIERLIARVHKGD